MGAGAGHTKIGQPRDGTECSNRLAHSDVDGASGWLYGDSPRGLCSVMGLFVDGVGHGSRGKPTMSGVSCRCRVLCENYVKGSLPAGREMNETILWKWLTSLQFTQRGPWG